MHTRLYLALACVLLLIRMPSLVQPMGADQGLYAYIGERILAGELPYRDAWDQKPPAIHYTYALLRAFPIGDAAIPLADLLIAAIVAWLLLRLGTRLAGQTTGMVASLLYLALSDPGFQRLAGAAVRAQCETFIAAAVTGAVVLLTSATPRAGTLVSAGVLLGAAASYKYNAAAYGIVALIALWTQRRLTLRALVPLAAGAAVIPLLLFGVLAAGGASRDLYFATIQYNLDYSGETYRGPLAFVSYLLTFPVLHARIDGLWLLGGAGCAVLLLAGWRDRNAWIPVAWVAAACLTIAINSSRGLPQYFTQAGPALALAAAWGGRTLWTSRRALNLAAVALVAFAVWRVNDFGNIAGNFLHDTRYIVGDSTRAEHLSRYGDRERRKYSALAMTELGGFIRDRTSPDDHIFVFGFAGGAYVYAERASASRFFWSRPVIVDFNAADPGYGVQGLRRDLEARPPAVVALQLRDWAPDVENSATFFLATPPLVEWLQQGYVRVDGPAGYDVWMRQERWDPLESTCRHASLSIL